MKLRIYTTLALLMFFGLTVNGQRHYFIPYSVNEGLAQSQVRDIVQSDDGFLWIATVGGISRFDGINFETFNKSNGLINNLTNALYPGPDGSMVASCPGGLVLFSGDQVSAFPFTSPYEDVLINDLILDGDQYILGSNGRGLLYFQNDSIVRRLDLGSSSRNFIRCLSWHGSQILAGTKDGLILIAQDGSSRVLNDSISVNEIASSPEGHWIATNGDGLYLFQNDSLQRFTRDDGLRSRYIRDVTIDHAGKPWILSKNRIQVFDPSSRSFRIIKSFEPEQTSNMKVIYADSEQNIWIGTDGFGILRYTGDQFQLFNTEDGLSSNIVMDIDQDAQGALYFATYGYGVIKWLETEVDTIQDDQGLSNLTVWSLLPRDEALWMGTSNGIQILENNRVTPFVGNADLPFPRVSNLFADSEGRVWICTRDGVSLWDGAKLEIPSSLATLELRDCKDVVEHDDRIWISSNKGLVSFRSNEEVKVYGVNEGMTEEYITCLAPGKTQDLWLGSEEGLIHFDIGNRTFNRYALSEKVSSNIINFIQNEGNKRLWMGTDNGLFQLDLDAFYNKAEIKIRGYNKYDGIISNECNQNASFVDHAGNVWFGTNGGLLKYDPSKAKRQENTVIGVYMTDIQQNFESVLDQVQRNATEYDINAFQYNESRLTFRFAAVHFTNPDKVRYSFRLGGLDNDWSPPSSENYITYSSLPYGSYEFDVRARVGNGEWISSARPFRFYVNPPFYLTWWFILSSVSVFVLLAWFVLNQYRRQQNRRRQLLEIQNRARVLGLEQQTLNAHMNRHFIFNALNSIQYYINTQDRKQANQYLTNFASLVRKNLDSAQVDSINLQEELDRLELYINLEQMRFKDRFTFEVQVGEYLDLESIQVPSMILQPFVENGIMHGILPSERNGTILIKIESHEAGIMVVIEDNGIGIDTSVGRKNGTSQHVSNGMKITKQRIEIIAQALDNTYGVNGPFQISDENGKAKGTRVEIVLPVNFQQFKEMYESKS